MQVNTEFCLTRCHTFEDLEEDTNKFLSSHKIISCTPYCYKDSQCKNDLLGFLIVYDDTEKEGKSDV